MFRHQRRQIGRRSVSHLLRLQRITQPTLAHPAPLKTMTLNGSTTTTTAAAAVLVEPKVKEKIQAEEIRPQLMHLRHYSYHHLLDRGEVAPLILFSIFKFL